MANLTTTTPLKNARITFTDGGEIEITVLDEDRSILGSLRTLELEDRQLKPRPAPDGPPIVINFGRCIPV